MSTAPLAAIQTALLANLTAAPDLTTPATPFAMPLVDYQPVPSVSYYDVRPLLTAEPEHFGLAYGNADIHKGVFQVDAVIPDGGGEALGLRLAAAVADRFPIGTLLSASGRRLEIINTPSIGPAVKDAPWVRFPVSIPWRLIR